VDELLCRIEQLEIFDEFEEWNIMQVYLPFLDCRCGSSEFGNDSGDKMRSE
jgi:hypothetical protein